MEMIVLVVVLLKNPPLAVMEVSIKLEKSVIMEIIMEKEHVP